MTFGEIKSAIYSDLGYEASPASAVTTRIGRWVNDGHKHLLRQPSLSDLRQGSVSFTSVANQAVYGLPMAFADIKSIVQQSNDARLVYRTRDWYRTVDPGERSTGNPTAWIDEGWQVVMIQPTTDGVWAASTDAADTTQSVKLQCVTANGDVQAIQSATLTGLTRVAVGSGFTTNVRILMWNLSAVAVGAVSLYDAATLGNELARIPIGATQVKYQGIRLWPTPAAALPYVVDGNFEVTDMTNASDVPMIPITFHDMLVTYGKLKQYQKDGDATRVMLMQAEWREWVGKLMASVEYPADYKPVAGSRSGNVGVNDLGGWFPADFWL